MKMNTTNLLRNAATAAAAAWLYIGTGTAAGSGQVFDAVVAADGTGQYATVQQAIDAAPAGRTSPWLIFVKAGSYEGSVVIPADKPFIHLIGQDSKLTSIHRSLNVGGKPEPGKAAADTAYWAHSVHNPASDVYGAPGSVVTVEASDFYTTGISYVNDYGVNAQNGPQALAMKSRGDRAAFFDCAFRSFQDTWMTTQNDAYRQYVSHCYIEGAVDYFYGGGNVLLENCTLFNVRRGSIIVAPSHDKAPWGYVFRNCTIDGNAEARRDAKTKLGRPWHNSPRAVYIHTTMNIPIAPEGWTDMGAIPALFAEYDSRDAEGRPIDLSRRKSSYKGRGDNPPTGTCPTTVTKAEADRMDYDHMMPGTDGWNPRAMMERLPAPAGVKADGDAVSWQPVAGARGYVVTAGDKVVGITAEPRLAAPPTTDLEQLRVRAVNSHGTLGL